MLVNVDAIHVNVARSRSLRVARRAISKLGSRRRHELQHYREVAQGERGGPPRAMFGQQSHCEAISGPLVHPLAKNDSSLIQATVLFGLIQVDSSVSNHSV